VPTYSYSCVVCGSFDVVRRMAEVGMETSCPDCGRTSGRVYGAPALRGLDLGVRRALDAQERSADAPTVVTSLPPRSAADQRRSPVMRRSTDPRQARLPRP
jgi:putative regulatory protein, FmdB family